MKYSGKAVDFDESSRCSWQAAFSVAPNIRYFELLMLKVKPDQHWVERHAEVQQKVAPAAAYYKIY